MEHVDDFDVVSPNAVHNTVRRFDQLAYALAPVAVNRLSEIWERCQPVASLKQSIYRTVCRVDRLGSDVIVYVGQRS